MPERCRPRRRKVGLWLTAPRLRVTAERTAQALRWPGAGRLRAIPASSLRVNSLNGTPSARQNSRSSTTSIRRSPRSHLLTNDCVSSSRFASSICVTPALFRVARSCRRKRAYPSVCSDFSMQALQLHEALGYSQYWNSPTSTIRSLVLRAQEDSQRRRKRIEESPGIRRGEIGGRHETGIDRAL